MMAENQSSEIFASPRECNSINYQLVCLPLINRSLRHYSVSLSLPSIRIFDPCAPLAIHILYFRLWWGRKEKIREARERCFDDRSV